MVAGPQVINTATGGSSVESQLSGMGNSNSTSAAEKQSEQRAPEDCVEVVNEDVESGNKTVAGENEEDALSVDEADSDDSSHDDHEIRARTSRTKKPAAASRTKDDGDSSESDEGSVALPLPQTRSRRSARGVL